MRQPDSAHMEPRITPAPSVINDDDDEENKDQSDE